MTHRIATVDVERAVDGNVTARVRDLERDLGRRVRGSALEAVAVALFSGLEEAERLAGARTLRELAERIERGDFVSVRVGEKEPVRRAGLVALDLLGEINESGGISEPTSLEATAEVRSLRARRAKSHAR